MSALDAIDRLEASLIPGTEQGRVRKGDIREAEAMIGRPLPIELSNLYLRHNGGTYLEGNLNFWPLAGRDLSLSQGSETLRAWHWPVPDELLLFGDTGGEELLALWSPADSDASAGTPVLLVAEGAESFAPTGTSFSRFLLTWLDLYSREPIAFAARDTDGGTRHEDEIAQVLARTDPSLPDRHPDPYARGFGVGNLREMYANPKSA